MSLDSLLTVLGMALVTYATRAGGLWLVGRIAPTPRVEAWLRHIPGAVLVSIVAPMALTNTLAEAVATGAAVLVAARTKNLLATMLVGVGVVWILRSLI